MRCLAVLSIFLMPMSVSAQVAQQPSEEIAVTDALQDCLAVENRLSRLACYDEVLGYEDPGSQSSSTVTGGWVFVESEDDFTNRNTSFVMLESDRAGVPMTDAPVQIIARCDGNGGNEIFVVAGGYIGARNDRIPVRYRFGDDPPINENWNESTNGTAAFLPRGYADFRTGLDTLQDFIFEITDYRGSRYSAAFEGVGVNADMLEYVLGGCS